MEVVVWCAQAIRKAERPSGNDLVSYLASSTALYSGSDPYNTGSQFPYIYPLLLATLIRPLAELPPRTVAVLWFMLSSACLLSVVNAAARCPGRAVLLWLGWLDPTGPWYFLAVLALISSDAAALSRGSDQAAPAEPLSPA